jgi:hypothetical protein
MKLTGLILALIHLVFAMLVCFEILRGLGLAPVNILLLLDYPCTLLLSKHLSFGADVYVVLIGLGTVWWYLIGTCLEAVVQRLRLRIQTKPQA